MMPEKELIDRIEAIEKRLDEINKLIELIEQKRGKTITEWLDGPIMAYGKHNITEDDLNNVHEYYKRRRN